jgi:plasmid stability protein
MEQRQQATSKKFVGLWLDADLAERLRAKAARQERSASAFIRKLLREELDR